MVSVWRSAVEERDGVVLLLFLIFPPPTGRTGDIIIIIFARQRRPSVPAGPNHLTPAVHPAAVAVRRRARSPRNEYE